MAPFGDNGGKGVKNIHSSTLTHTAAGESGPSWSRDREAQVDPATQCYPIGASDKNVFVMGPLSVQQ